MTRTAVADGRRPPARRRGHGGGGGERGCPGGARARQRGLAGRGVVGGGRWRPEFGEEDGGERRTDLARRARFARSRASRQAPCYRGGGGSRGGDVDAHQFVLDASERRRCSGGHHWLHSGGGRTRVTVEGETGRGKGAWEQVWSSGGLLIHRRQGKGGPGCDGPVVDTATAAAVKPLSSTGKMAFCQKNPRHCFFNYRRVRQQLWRFKLRPLNFFINSAKIHVGFKYHPEAPQKLGLQNKKF